MRAETFDINELIEALRGTCSNIEDHLPEGMHWHDLTTQDHNSIDAEIFLCDTCGWWCEALECNTDPEDGQYICDDCLRDKTEIDDE